MMTISKNIAHTGPIELSADLLTMVSGAGENGKPEPLKPAEGTKLYIDNYKNTFYGHVDYTIPVNKNVDLTIKLYGDTDRGATAGYATVSYTW